MDLGLQGKKAVVTGASAGIGKAVTRTLAREGVDVAICARRKEPLEQAAAEISKETGRKIVPIAADLTKAKDAENFIKQAHAALGRIDILVNNAGAAPGGVIEHLSEEEWASALQLKFMGYVRCMKHVLPIMQKQRKGRVVNVIGNHGVKVSYGDIAHGAAKAAGQNLTGKATAVLTPARRANGARQQSCSSPRSVMWTRSRSRQARPLSPSPSRNRAVRVSRWNSSSTRPESREKASAFSAASTAQ